MNVLDLFSGIGGFSLGLERAGFKTVGFCEIDKHCQKVLRKHWHNVPIYDDVTKLKGKDFKNVDLLCGGVPCQDVSVAGKKEGLESEKVILQDIEREIEGVMGDYTTSFFPGRKERNFSELCERIARSCPGRKTETTRSGLWKEYKRLIKEIEPRYAIIENVANLRSLGLNQIIKDLWSIGYACEWHIISARSAGAPHLRERVWIITYPHSDKLRKQQECEPRGQKEGVSRVDGEKWETSYSSSKGLQGAGGAIEKYEKPTRPNRERRDLLFSTDSDMPRLWKPFTSEKEKSEWWTEATASFRDRWKIESGICRVDDGVSKRVVERERKERIKQLGNSVVPQIPELIGREILKWENKS